ncbi:MAG: hypothetical protein ACOYXY_15120, partial [Thermodesulfobacteriota bacterium]
MDKKNIIIAGSLLMIVMFLLQSFYLGGGQAASGPVFRPGDNVTGTTVFNGTIRTYDPLLYMDPVSDQTLINELRNLPGVLDVKSETNALIVQTETRDDVFPTALWLSERNITTYSVANIAVTSNMQVQTATGLMNATLLGGVVRVVTEPLVDAGEQVGVSMVAVVSSGQIIDYSSASLLMQPVDFTIEAEVVSLDWTTVTYSVPWEERNSIDPSAFDEAEYQKVDSIIFESPLTPSQVIAKKQFSYITYIDENSAQVESGFDNLTRIETNFQDVNYSLPSSTLVIRAQEAPEINLTP